MLVNTVVCGAVVGKDHIRVRAMYGKGSVLLVCIRDVMVKG